MSESDAADKALFLDSCREAASFPLNLVYYDTYEHNLKAYVKRLDLRERLLFCRELNSILDLWEYDDETRRFKEEKIEGINKLKIHFTGDPESGKRDPKCRLIFINAPNSREWLNTSRGMMTYALSYHQVMPSFLDFLFSFGRQEHARDFHFSGFSHEIDRKGLRIQALGRSGQEIRMCYSLKSVEVSNGQQDWPWSIRQTAIYYSLDVATSAMTWVVVEDNQLIQRRMKSITESPSFRSSSAFDTGTTGFGSSMALHLVICDWCGEDWRWYIDFLEERLHEKTRRSLAVPINKSYKTPSVSTENPTHRSEWSTMSSSIPGKRLQSGMSISQDMELLSLASMPPGPPPGPPPPPPPGRNKAVSLSSSPGNGPDYSGEFSFEDLLIVQSLEERANEIPLILESNIRVLIELEQHYELVQANSELPQKASDGDLSRFTSRLASIVIDLRIQQSRTKTLLRLIADRKSMLHGILEYRNTEASRILAMRAQQSTHNMEVMTEDMHIIAQKTKQEAVSMRIITLVTLFFLPATLISTIMSTDIIKFKKDNTEKLEKVFQLPAIRLYLAITLPLTFVVFVAWYGVRCWVTQKEVLERMKRRIQTGSMTV